MARPRAALWMGLGLSVFAVGALAWVAAAGHRTAGDVARAEPNPASLPVSSPALAVAASPSAVAAAAPALAPADPNPAPAESDAPAAASESPAESAAAAVERGGAPELAASAQGAVAGVTAPPGPGAVQAAFRATPIVMFSTQWCPVCARARAFFRSNGIAVEERDIDADADARAELKRRTGKTLIPTLVIDRELQTPGFDEDGVLRAMVRSVERRLGVHGLGFRRGTGT